jgi:hypothetical protein
MWNSKMDEMVKIAAGLTKKNKKGKSGKELMKKYLSIGPHTRNQVLNTHLYERKQTFKIKVKDYVTALKQYRDFKQRAIAIRNLLNAGKSPLRAMVPPVKPVFEFLPTELGMAKMIESTVNAS